MTDAWQPKRFTNAERLAVAYELKEQLLGKYGSKILAIALEGSTAKGLDRPESDLELRVVLREGRHRWYAFFYRGMFVGISYNSLKNNREDVSGIDYTWPVESDALFTSTVLYDPEGLFDELRAKAHETEQQADFRGLIVEALADLQERVLKVFSLEEREAATGLLPQLSGVANWAAITVGLANRHRYLQSRAMYAESFELSDLPAGYEENMRALLSNSLSLPAAKETVGRLWASFDVWASQKGLNLVDDSLDHI